MAEFLDKAMRAARTGLGRATSAINGGTPPSVTTPTPTPAVATPTPLPGGAQPISPALAGDAVDAYGSANAAATPLSKTAAGARASGVMSPEASAFKPASMAAPTAAEVGATAPGLGRAASMLKAVGNSPIIARTAGVVQGGLAANDMLNSGVNVDNATDLASGAAKFAGPAGIVGSTAFDVGKAAGQNLLPDSVATGLAKAYNVITGNSARNNTASGVQPNMAEINRIAAANPGGATARMLASSNAPAGAVVPPPVAAAPVADTAAAPEAPSKFGSLIDRLANQPAYQPIQRGSSAAAYAPPPEIDTSGVPNDGTGLATLGKIAAQRGDVANWAAGMKRAKGIDTQNLAYDELDQRGGNAAAERQMQGLGRAADIYAQQGQRGYERELALHKYGIEQRNENEKRIGDQMDRDFGPSTFKDGEDKNPARTKAEKQLQTTLGRVGKVRGDLSPSQYAEVRDAIQTDAAGDKGLLANAVNKMFGYSGDTTNDPIKATTTTGARGPGGVGEVTADNRVKWASTLLHGGLLGGGNQEMIERSRRDNARAAGGF